MSESAWRSASQLLVWKLGPRTGGPHASSLADQLDRIERERSFERSVGTFAKTDAERAAFRAIMDGLDRAAAAILSTVEATIREELLAGTLIGFGYSSPDAELAPIRRSHWAFMEIDFDRDSAAGNGIAYSGLRFVEKRRLKRILRDLPERWRSFTGEDDPLPAGDPPSQDVDPYRTGLPGRPTVRHLFMEKFRERIRDGSALQSLSFEARALSKWLEQQHPKAPKPARGTIENAIRDEHRAYLLSGVVPQTPDETPTE